MGYQAIPAWIKNGVKSTQNGTERKSKEPKATLEIFLMMKPKVLEEEVDLQMSEGMQRET